MFFAVFRHGERALDSQDPHLSDLGVSQAQDLANFCLKSMEGSPCQILRVVASPYLRCISTAMEVIKMYETHGWACELLLDEGFGEMYNEQGFQEQPTSPRHLSYTAISEKVSRHVQVHGVSEKPIIWGETWNQAIARNQRRLIRWSKSRKCNTIVIAHASTVYAAVRLHISAHLDFCAIPPCSGIVLEVDTRGVHKCMELKTRNLDLDLPSKRHPSPQDDCSPCSSPGVPAYVAQDKASVAISSAKEVTLVLPKRRLMRRGHVVAPPPDQATCQAGLAQPQEFARSITA